MSSTFMFRGFHSLCCTKAFWVVICATASWGTFLSPCLPSHISCLVSLDIWGQNQHIHAINFIISVNWKLRKGIFVGCHKEPRFHLHFSPIPVCPEYDAECLSRCSPNSYQAGMRECMCICHQTDCDVHQGHWFSLSSIRQLMYDSKEVHFVLETQ